MAEHEVLPVYYFYRHAQPQAFAFVSKHTDVKVMEPPKRYETSVIDALVQRLLQLTFIPHMSWNFDSFNTVPLVQNLDSQSAWATYFHALRSNKLTIPLLTLINIDSDTRFFIALCDALQTNHTVSALHLCIWPSVACANALAKMLQTRAAPLSIWFESLQAWLDPNVAFGQADLPTDVIGTTLSKWACVHRASLTVDQWPAQWKQVQGLTLKRIVIRNEADCSQYLIQFIHGNVVSELVFKKHNDVFVHELLRHDESKTWPFLRSLHTCAVMFRLSMKTFMNAFPNLRILADGLRPGHVTELVRYNKTITSLQSIALQYMPENHKQLAGLLTICPLLRELRFQNVLTAVDKPPQYDINAMVRILSAHNITRLAVRVCDATKHWLPDLLRHPRCPITLLIYTIAYSKLSWDAEWFWYSALYENTSLRTFVSMYDDDSYGVDDGVIMHALYRRPQLMMFDSGFCCDQKYTNKYQHALRSRQMRYAVQRDTWQQTCFVLLWWKALHQHSLRNSCFAWLTNLRNMLGGAMESNYEALEGEPYEQITEHLYDLWHFHNDSDSVRRFAQHASAFQSSFVVETQWFSAVAAKPYKRRR